MSMSTIIKRISLSICILFCSMHMFAQGSIKKADAAFEKKNYATAADLYQKAIENEKDKKIIGYASFQIAECYRIANKYPQAITWYKRAHDVKYKDETKTMYFNYGNMLMMAGDYALAKKMYKTHLTRNSKDQFAKMKIKSCDFADTAKSLENIYDHRNVQELNTSFNEFSPAFCKEKVIFSTSRPTPDGFTYNVTGEGFEDLYETFHNEQSNIWAPPVKLVGINTTYNDGTFSFDPNRNIAYIMQCNGAKGVEKNCNIYTSDYNESTNSWTKPKKFDHFSTAYSSGHPTISPDGNTLYFASNNPAGLGGTDIWVIQRDPQTEKWGKPENLGSPINTPFNEMFPYTFDTKGIYFSSNGHMGFGGLDIYYSEKIDTVFANPVNLKAPFNSSADDFGLLLLADNSGFFTSSRPGGVGGDDLYYFEFKKVEIVAAGRVTDKDTYQPIPNAIVVIQNNSKQTSDTLITDEFGVYSYPFLEKDMDYTFITFKDEFLNPESKWVSTMGITENTYMDSLHGYDLNFTMHKIIAGKEYIIRDIFYDLDKYSLRPESINELNNIVNILNNNPDICIQINSHTDNRATDEYNITLSHNRAKSVVDYLISQNISDKRLAWQGWGETRPLVPDAQTEEEHQMNRRTSFTIVNVDQLHLGEKAVFHNQLAQRVTQSQGNEEPVEQGIYYRIQISATRSACNAQTFTKIEKQFPGIPTYCTKYPDGFYRYTVGLYKSLDEVEAIKAKIDLLGYNSFIVAYNNGQKISINQALKLTRPIDDTPIEITE